MFAYFTLIQPDAISHTDVGFLRSLTWTPVICHFIPQGTDGLYEY